MDAVDVHQMDGGPSPRSRCLITGRGTSIYCFTTSWLTSLYPTSPPPSLFQHKSAEASFSILLSIYPYQSTSTGDIDHFPNLNSAASAVLSDSQRKNGSSSNL